MKERQGWLQVGACTDHNIVSMIVLTSPVLAHPRSAEIFVPLVQSVKLSIWVRICSTNCCTPSPLIDQKAAASRKGIKKRYVD